jgi:hypothetical protein
MAPCRDAPPGPRAAIANAQPPVPPPAEEGQAPCNPGTILHNYSRPSADRTSGHAAMRGHTRGTSTRTEPADFCPAATSELGSYGDDTVRLWLPVDGDGHGRESTAAGHSIHGDRPEGRRGYVARYRRGRNGFIIDPFNQRWHAATCPRLLSMTTGEPKWFAATAAAREAFLRQRLARYPTAKPVLARATCSRSPRSPAATARAVMPVVHPPPVHRGRVLPLERRGTVAVTTEAPVHKNQHHGHRLWCPSHTHS